MIRSAGAKFSVQLRQHLKTAAKVEEFTTELVALLEDEVKAGRTPIFEDFDISQNCIHAEGFEEIFLQLMVSEAHVERFRAFGCAAFDDTVASSMATWLAGATAEAMPAELHLSDCALTAKGFDVLAQALEENEALPVPDPRDAEKTIPVYVRLEHNYIDEAAIRARSEAGAMVAWRKNDPIPQEPGVKWRLVVWDQGQFGQKTGAPDGVAGRGVVVAPKAGVATEPVSHPLVVVPGRPPPPRGVPPAVVVPPPPAAKPLASGLANRVLAPKVAAPRAVAPPAPRIVAPRAPAPAAAVVAPPAPTPVAPRQPHTVPPRTPAPKTVQPRPSSARAGDAKPPSQPKPSASVAPLLAKRVMAPRAPRPPAGPPPPQLAAKAGPYVRPPAPRIAVPSSAPKKDRKDSPQVVDLVAADDKPRPPRGPPPAAMMAAATGKFMAAPKAKMRSKPY